MSEPASPWKGWDDMERVTEFLATLGDYMPDQISSFAIVVSWHGIDDQGRQTCNREIYTSLDDPSQVTGYLLESAFNNEEC